MRCTSTIDPIASRLTVLMEALVMGFAPNERMRRMSDNVGDWKTSAVLFCNATCWYPILPSCSVCSWVKDLGKSTIRFASCKGKQLSIGNAIGKPSLLRG